MVVGLTTDNFIADNFNFLNEFRQSLKDPRKVQEKVLLRIIEKNKNTVYGKKYQFEKIQSIKDFQKKVPVVSYEDIIPYIEKLKNNEPNILTKDKVIYFATTSGTTKAVKLIPVTAERTKIFRRELSLWSFFMLRKFKKIMTGKTLYFAGPYTEFYTNKGIPCGSISGYLAHKTPWIIKKKLVVNPKIYNIMNFDEKTRKIAISALLSNITQIGFASPIEAILFFDYIAKNKDSLINELKRKGKQKDANRLRKLKNFNPANIWPNLFLINCIKSKTNQIYLETLKEKIGKDIIIRDPGIYSSEGRLSLCLEDEGIAGIIPANENFFEFLEQKNGKSQGPPITAEKVKLGKEYLVIITTPEGLYRYDMGDIIKIAGFREKLPLIEFVNRNNYLNIAGELAHENILIESMQMAMKTANINLRSFTFLPLISPAKKPRYEVLIEPIKTTSKSDAKKFLKIVDDSLQKNISDYKQMRNEFGRMDFPRLTILKKGSYDLFDKKRVTSVGQPKPIYVSKNAEFRNNFEVSEMIEHD
jgi:hypothetical protein